MRVDCRMRCLFETAFSAQGAEDFDFACLTGQAVQYFLRA